MLGASCTKQLRYSKEEIYNKTVAADPTATLVMPKSIGEGVTCAEYPSGCLSAHVVRIKNLELIAVEFASEDDAIIAAKKLRAYYARNWLFDDVFGEPVLERFVTEKLEAKKP